MSEIDLDRLGDVWRAQSDPAEIERLRRSAAKVRRSALLGQAADVWLALVVSAVVLVLIISNARIETGIAGGAAILFLLFSTVRQRRLRAIELATLNASTEHMLDQSILRVEATIRRAWLSIVLMPFGLLVGLGFGAAVDLGQGSSLLRRVMADSFLKGVVVIGLIVASIAICVHFLRIGRLARQERERLVQMRADYQAESAAE